MDCLIVITFYSYYKNLYSISFNRRGRTSYRRPYITELEPSKYNFRIKILWKILNSSLSLWDVLKISN